MAEDTQPETEPKPTITLRDLSVEDESAGDVVGGARILTPDADRDTK